MQDPRRLAARARSTPSETQLPVFFCQGGGGNNLDDSQHDALAVADNVPPGGVSEVILVEGRGFHACPA